MALFEPMSHSFTFQALVTSVSHKHGKIYIQTNAWTEVLALFVKGVAILIHDCF